MRKGILIPIILALATTPVSAAMFKWTDANGNVQYGEFPPAGVQAERIKGSPQPRSQPRDTSSPQQRLKEMERQQRQQDAQTDQAEADRQREEARQENCRIAKKNLATLQAGGNRRIRLPDGTVTYLDDEQRRQRIEENQKRVKEFCD